MTSAKPTVAIFGATGHLGMHITHAFLTENIRPDFKQIVLFTRKSADLPYEIELWLDAGVVGASQIRPSTTGLRDQLLEYNVDIVVNVVGSAGDQLRTQILQAMVGTNVKLYFPSEFGVDHTVHDFGHQEWDKKKAHYKLAVANLPNTKICRVYAGLFTEDSIGPWFGFDTKNDRYESYGNSNVKASYTSLDDVGKAVANLALLPFDQIPDQVHLSGDRASMRDIANIMHRKSGSIIKTDEVDLKENRERELATATSDPSGCLRVLMGEGRIDHSTDGLGCENELINPGESKWKWKTLSDLAEESGGRPWVDTTWP